MATARGGAAWPSDQGSETGSGLAIASGGDRPPPRAGRPSPWGPLAPAGLAAGGEELIELLIGRATCKPYTRKSRDRPCRRGTTCMSTPPPPPPPPPPPLPPPPPPPCPRLESFSRASWLRFRAAASKAGAASTIRATRLAAAEEEGDDDDKVEAAEAAAGEVSAREGGRNGPPPPTPAAAAAAARATAALFRSGVRGPAASESPLEPPLPFKPLRRGDRSPFGGRKKPAAEAAAVAKGAGGGVVGSSGGRKPHREDAKRSPR
mmetsp:Transcript_66939/g.151252  ORF Transcript_66939/g.151252 Transcript_66939/m.151252 type:complete len:263 (+) Transcript_66939:1155-1943(+)